MQSDYAWPTLAFVALTVLSIAADWLRHRRLKADDTLSREHEHGTAVAISPENALMQ